MSIIAAKIQEDKIIIGADTQTTRGGYLKLLNTPKNGHGKLYCIDDIIVIGVAGDAATMEFFRRFLKDTKKLRKVGFNDSDFAELMMSFNEKLQEDSDEKLNIKHNSFLFSYNGKCYQFAAWHIFEVQEFTAIGSGSEIAFAAYETQKLYGLEFSMENVLRAACHIDLYCHEPVIIYEMDKKTGKVQLLVG